MGLDDGVRDGGTPRHCANRENGEAAIAGDVLQPVREIALALTAQPGDPMRRNPAEATGIEANGLQKFQPVEQAVHVGGILACLEAAQPDEPAHLLVHRLGQEAVEPGAQIIAKTIGDTGFDPAFRRDQGIGAEPLDARYARQDGLCPAAFLDEASNQILVGPCGFRFSLQPRLQIARPPPRKHPIAVDHAEALQMFSPRLFPNGVAFKIIRLHADLGADKVEYARGDQLSGVQQTTRMPERTELEAKPSLFCGRRRARTCSISSSSKV